MKSLQAPNLKTIALTKAVYTAIRRYVYEAFDDTSEESGKKTKNILCASSLINHCGPFQLEALLSRPNKMVT